MSLFLTKYFFVLKAASEGWSVSYKGGDQFKFSKHTGDIKYTGGTETLLDPLGFVTKYSNK
jgi:hypothetical protein